MRSRGVKSVTGGGNGLANIGKGVDGRPRRERPKTPGHGGERFHWQIDVIARMQKALRPSYMMPLRRFLVFVSLMGSGDLIYGACAVTTMFGSQALSLRMHAGFCLALSLAAAAKSIARLPRPYLISQKVEHYDPTLEESYGFPSGHCVCFTFVYGTLAVWSGLWWLKVSTVIGAVFMMLSRTYTAAHFIHDVIGGCVLGCVAVALVSWSGTGWLTPAFCIVMATALISLNVSLFRQKNGDMDCRLCNEGCDAAGITLGLSVVLFLLDRFGGPPVEDRLFVRLLAAVASGALILTYAKMEKSVIGKYRHEPIPMMSFMLFLVYRCVGQVFVVWVMPQLFGVVGTVVDSLST